MLELLYFGQSVEKHNIIIVQKIGVLGHVGIWKPAAVLKQFSTWVEEQWPKNDKLQVQIQTCDMTCPWAQDPSHGNGPSTWSRIDCPFGLLFKTGPHYTCILSHLKEILKQN